MIKFSLLIIIFFTLIACIYLLRYKVNIFKESDGSRWCNDSIPNIGGVAVIGSLSWFFWGLGDPVFFYIVVLFWLGLFDDLVGIKYAWLKFVFHLAIAVGTVSVGYQLHWFSNIYLDQIITCIWIVGLINAFNLIDNMDGHLTVISFIVVASFATLFFPSNIEMFSAIMIILFLFFLFNCPAACVWMGDCGSIVLGYLFGILSLNYYGTIKSFSFIPILVVLFPLVDMSFVTITRTLKGKKFWIGGTDHLSHRLVRFMGSEYLALLLVGMVQFTMGMVAICLKN